MNEKALITKDSAERAQPLSIREVFQAVQENKLSKEHVDVMKELLAMDAKQKFAAAFSELQKVIPEIRAEKPGAPTRDGQIKYYYAPTEDIMAQLKPHLDAHGFGVKFSQRLGDKTVTSICTVTHVGGHSEVNEFTLRCGSGPHGGTERDADVAGGTVAQREALCDAFNIMRRRQSDARMEGGKITAAQAEELERRVKMLNKNVPNFLKLAHANSFAEIKSSVFEVVEEIVTRWEKQGGK